MDEWIKKLWYMYTMEYSAMRKKEILSLVTAWMDLKDIILNEMSDRERQILYDITYMWNLKKPNLQKKRVEWCLPEAVGYGKREGIDQRV